MKFLKWLPALPVCVFAAAVCMQACGTTGQPGEKALTGELAEGRDAAQKYCGTCHLPVAPELLDKETWKSRVLPVMAQQLGMEVWQKNQYFAGEHSAMPITEWMKIVEYYDSLAPAHLPVTRPPLPAREDWGALRSKSRPGIRRTWPPPRWSRSTVRGRRFTRAVPKCPRSSAGTGPLAGQQKPR